MIESLAIVKTDQSYRLGLVAETLFMAVLLHALFALVLIDLGLTTFFDGAHGYTVGVSLR